MYNNVIIPTRPGEVFNSSIYITFAVNIQNFPITEKMYKNA